MDIPLYFQNVILLVGTFSFFHTTSTLFSCSTVVALVQFVDVVQVYAVVVVEL